MKHNHILNDHNPKNDNHSIILSIIYHFINTQSHPEHHLTFFVIKLTK